jgi:hypothetical protein
MKPILRTNAMAEHEAVNFWLNLKLSDDAVPSYLDYLMMDNIQNPTDFDCASDLAKRTLSIPPYTGKIKFNQKRNHNNIRKAVMK